MLVTELCDCARAQAEGSEASPAGGQASRETDGTDPERQAVRGTV